MSSPPPDLSRLTAPVASERGADVATEPTDAAPPVPLPVARPRGWVWWGALVVLFVVGAELGALQAFLSVGWLGVGLAVLLNVPVSWAVTVVAGRRVAVVPVLLGWLAAVVVLGISRPEGDFVIPGTASGTVFVLVGALTLAVPVVVDVRRYTPARVRRRLARRGWLAVQADDDPTVARRPGGGVR